jgi:excisionase family DNA binding protein
MEAQAQAVIDAGSMAQDIPAVMDLNKLADVLGVGYSTAWELIKQDQIKARKVGREWRISRDAVIAFFAAPEPEK